MKSGATTLAMSKAAFLERTISTRAVGNKPKRLMAIPTPITGDIHMFGKIDGQKKS